MGNALGLTSPPSVQIGANCPSKGVVDGGMAEPVQSVAAGPSGPTDPWDWSVEEVIDAVCYQKGSLLDDINTSELVLTDPQAFERTLRENSVRGLHFLTDVDHGSLRGDLCMTRLGDRSSVLHLIQALRRKSAKYISCLHEQAAIRSLSAYDRLPSIVHEQERGSLFSFPPGNHNVAARTHGILNQYLPTAPGSRIDNWVQDQHPPLRLPSLGQSSPGERSFTVPSERPLLPPAIPFGGTIPVDPDFPDAPMGLQETENMTKYISDVGNEDLVRPLISDPDAPVPISGGYRVDSANPIGTSGRIGETIIVDEAGKKRRRLVLGPSEPLSAAALAKRHDNYAETPERPSSAEMQQDLGPPTDEKAHAAANEHQIPSSTEVDLSANTTCAVTRSDSASPNSISTAEPGAGVVTVDDTGRKRIKTLLLSSLEPSDSLDTGRNTTLQDASSTPAKFGRARSARGSEDAYLGTSALHVDCIFYGNSPIGQEIQNDLQHDSAVSTEGVHHSENFRIVSNSDIATGLRIYVNSQLQHFIRSVKPMKFRRKGHEVTGIIPYPESLARKYQPLSMTIFKKSSDGYTATRVNRSAWYSIDEEPAANSENDIDTFNFPEIPSLQQDEDPLDPDKLEKWKYLAGEDKVLPVYGDSGSEGEYDLETWREMEKEQGKLGRPGARPSRNRSLDDAQVNTIIDNALEHFVKDWHTQKKPNLQRKRYRLWHKFRQDGGKDAWISVLNATIQHFDARLLSIRKEILGEVWSTEKQVLKQTKSMQETVFDQEYAKWEMSIMELKTPPEKPAPLPQTSKPEKVKLNPLPLNDGEENIDSDNIDSDSSDGGMDNFIVNDDNDEGSPLNDELMADPEQGECSDMPLTVGVDDTTSKLSTSTSAADADGPKDLVKNPLFKLERKAAVTLKGEAISKSETEYIDLTSDPVEPVAFVPQVQLKSRPPSAIHTPPLDAEDDADFSFRHERRKPVAFKQPPGQPPAEPEIINLESDSDTQNNLDKPSTTQSPLPALHEVEKISQMSIECLEERQDRKRLLIYIIARCRQDRRQNALMAFDQMSFREMETKVWRSLASLRSHNLKVRGLNLSESDACMLITSWFISWTIPVIMEPEGGIKVSHIIMALDDKAGFGSFYEFLERCLAHYRPPLKLESLSLKSAKETPVKRILISPSADDSQDTPKKKRKYVVQESQQAKNLQSLAQERVREQERRKGQLKHRFKAMSVNDEDPNKVIVNVGKEDHQGFIYLNPNIGERIQEHQKDGVRFIWRELTAGHEELQGCLLAHTMGLGKTMQVITFLVTLAEASRSSNDKIADQIPPALRKSQTLVLCPPSLLENWYEEFLMWAPDPFSENIGDIRKITSAMKISERIDEIDQWRDKGGILLLGYTTFRSFISFTEKTNGRPSKNAETNQNRYLTEAVRQRMTETLLETPHLIVADEAHSFKSLDSGLYKAMKRFVSPSRVALTGSPLSNNLNEYYAVIDWIAPNYLGDHVQFRAHYIEPIEQGLYKESTPADYLESRKRLKALQLTLEPKVHRADNSVLKERLRGKVEFLIRVPLTELQAQIYRDYVAYMLGTVGNIDPSATTATLWTWLQDLRVLCNHPKCFEEKLRQRLSRVRHDARPAEAGSLPSAHTGKKKRKTRKTAQSEVVDSDEESADPGLPVVLTESLLAIYRTHSTPLESLSLSFKLLVLKQILDFAEKAGDKALVFSHSIVTLDYFSTVLDAEKKSYLRIDGGTPTVKRQEITRKFNQTDSQNICLISTRAGGLGLNMYGANRVIILDSHFNPMHEEQAIGRAYRIGQPKVVYVYRLTVGGTFEEGLINQAIFKQQLATRVVDKKNPRRHALKGTKQYLFQPRTLKQEEFSGCVGKDPLILDKIFSNNEG